MPRFPFPRSPGQDLRDLFAHDRLQASVNQLRNSSLSPGEGAIDILDSAGNVVAMFGHASGALAGFLVPNGSGWETTTQQAARLVQEGTAYLNNRMGDVEGRLGNVEPRVGTLEGRADSHASRIGAAEGDIATLQSTKVSQTTHNALAGRVGTLEGRADSHVARIGRAEDAIESGNNWAFGQLKSISDRVSTLEGGGPKVIANPPPVAKG